MEDISFNFEEFVNAIRENKPSHIVSLLDYLAQEYIRKIISLLMERGVKQGEKYLLIRDLPIKSAYFKHFMV